MPRPLTKKTGAKANTFQLTKKIDVLEEASHHLTKEQESKVVLCFYFKLENNYSFTKMKNEHLKELQKFLNDASELSIDEIERRYKRKTDDNDTFLYHNNLFQVEHFGKDGSKFRIHGFYANGMFYVIRLDPNHRFHRM